MSNENDRIDRTAENPLLLFVKLISKPETGPEIKVFYPNDQTGSNQQQLEVIKRYAFPFDIKQVRGYFLIWKYFPYLVIIS